MSAAARRARQEGEDAQAGRSTFLRDQVFEVVDPAKQVPPDYTVTELLKSFRQCADTKSQWSNTGLDLM